MFCRVRSEAMVEDEGEYLRATSIFCCASRPSIKTEGLGRGVLNVCGQLRSKFNTHPPNPCLFVMCDRTGASSF